ncbi:MAG: hypothetical protein JW883_12575 [Deltaproteobacteria bacterium]|nr:hypothetical protein [Deltaproteobacteria bacterium]
MKLLKSEFVAHRVQCFRVVLITLVGWVLVASSSTLAADITVDASVNEGVFDNIAGGINFWGPTEISERFRSEVGADLYRLKLRMDQVECDADTNTYSNYRLEGTAPSEAVDVIANANLAAENGCKIVLQVYGIPKWLSTSIDENVVTNNLPNYAKYPPEDYYVWAKVVYAGFRSLKNAGLNRIDYCEVFGEPNCGSTWYMQKMPCLVDGEVVYNCAVNGLRHNTFQVMKNFLRVYKYTAMGARAAEPDIVVGGPAIVPNISGIWWTRYLCHFLRFYNQPMGFYSWHWYGVDEVLSSMLGKMAPYEPLSESVIKYFYKQDLEAQGFPPDYVRVFLYDIYDYLKDLEQWGQVAVRSPYSFVSSNLYRIMAEEGLSSNELFLTEWNVNHIPDRRHDTHYGASFVTKGLMDIANSVTDGQTYYFLASKPYYDDNGYGGGWSLFTLDGSNVPKASFNAFKLFSMLGENAEQISAICSQSDLYAIATKDTDAVSLLATYYVVPDNPWDPDYTLSKSVTLRVENVPFPSYNYEIYLIDGGHSNSYYGSGPELEMIDGGTGSGGFEKVMDLSVYGVVMVKLRQPE